MNEISPREAHDAWRDGRMVIVDVREQHEHDTTHIDGVPLIPLSEVFSRIDEFPTDTPLAVLCRSGRRSQSVVDILLAQGDWTEVANLEGGILAWASEGLPYTGEPPQ